MNRHIYFLLPQILVLAFATPSQAQVVINEYSCSNRSIADDFGNYEDWVEFYNPSPQAVNLTGYYLSDKPNNPTKWQFPGGVVPAGGRLVVVCSGRDVMQGTTLHTNFRLNQLEPESIVFSAPDVELLELRLLETTQNGHSRGRVIDGSIVWGVFATPTRGTANAAVANGYAANPVLSHEAGFYTGSITVSIAAAGPNTIIRYTTDGSDPGLGSPQYNAPITISATTVLRARGFSMVAGFLPGFIETNTYFINTNHTVPVVSVCGSDLATLLGGTQFDPIGSLEYFDADGIFRDEAVGDFNKHGNDSWAYAQRGIDFIARDEYGYNDEIRHKVFATTERDRFKRLILKAGANDNYPFESGGAHIRDPFVQTLSQLGGLHLDERSNTFCVLYLNGQYHGIYDIREKVDDHDFTEYYYNQKRKYKGSPEFIQFLKTWGGTWAEYGEQPAINDWNWLRNFIQSNDMGVTANFATVTDNLQLESLIDYFVLNSFIVSQDWLNWNTGWWRGLDPEGDMRRWRYILWDLDASFGHYINYTSIPDSSPDADPCNAENLPDPGGQGHTNILSKLIAENPAAHNLYVSRQATLMNTVFSCQNMLHVLDSMTAVLAAEMPRHTQRWGGSVAGWQANIQQLRNFVEARCVSVGEGVADCYELEGPFNLHIKVMPEDAGSVNLNTLSLPQLPFNASVFGGLTTDFEALPAQNFVFDHWELNNHTPASGPGTNGITVGFTQGDTLVAVFEPESVVVDDRLLLYYWHFNTLNTDAGDVTEIDADYTLIPSADPKMRYTGNGERDIDSYGTGTLLNVQLDEETGLAARVRNPSIARSLVFNMPTTGYNDIGFSYAVHRSGSGMLTHNIAYSVNGTDYLQSGLPVTSFSISEDYEVFNVDLSGIAAVNDNANFHIRITFEGNTTQSNGNNRFDNITLKGREMEGLSIADLAYGSEVTLIPNPFEDGFRVEAGTTIRQIRVHSLTGALVTERAVSGNTAQVQLDGISAGMYIVSVFTDSGVRHLRAVKR